MADLAQWSERLVVAQEAVGSNPTIRPLCQGGPEKTHRRPLPARD